MSRLDEIERQLIAAWNALTTLNGDLSNEHAAKGIREELP